MPTLHCHPWLRDFDDNNQNLTKRRWTCRNSPRGFEPPRVRVWVCVVGFSSIVPSKNVNTSLCCETETKHTAFSNTISASSCQFIALRFVPLPDQLHHPSFVVCMQACSTDEALVQSVWLDVVKMLENLSSARM